ncbi:MAG TPA: H-X9-DG-CTERM domain-containing protein [Abditibacteriaceae bacterium]|jgi:prepilin-type processing-associated H-X9-DG protein
MNKQQFRNIPLSLPALPFLFVGVALFLRSDWYTNTPFFHPSKRTSRSNCQGNLRNLYLGLKQYQQDYDGVLPPAKIGGNRGGTSESSGIYPYVGWGDAIIPYHKNSTAYICYDTLPQVPPSIPLRGVKPALSGYTDFWMNSNLSGLRTTTLPHPAATLLLGEGNDGTDVTDASYNRNSIPAKWIADRTMPTWRHIGTANYLFADGHVAALKPNEVTSNFGRSNCFAVK